MPAMQHWERWTLNPLYQEYAPRLLAWQDEAQDAGELLQLALSGLLEVIDGDFAAVVRTTAGQWHTEAASGRAQPLPWEMLGDVLDNEQPAVLGSWRAAMLAPRSDESELLVVHAAQKVVDGPAMQALASALHVALSSVRERTQL